MNQELERLIEAALVDGVIEESERQVIRRKAEKLGEDPDEIEMILNSKLQTLQKQQKAAAQKVKKCPSCGATIEALSTSCGECGYVFTDVKAVGSAQRFADGLQAIYNEKKFSTVVSGIGDLMGTSAHIQKVISYIQNFPIPNGKEDLFEFIIVMRERAGSMTGNQQVSKAYRSKKKEAIEKASLLFPNDPMMQDLINKNKKFSWSNATDQQKFFIGGAIFLVIFLIICGIIS